MPFALRLVDLELHRGAVQPVVNRERLDDGLVRERQLPGFLEPAGRAVCGDRELVDVRDVVGIADLAQQAEPLLGPIEGRVEVSGPERSHALPCPGVREELRVAKAFRELHRLLGNLGPGTGQPDGAGDQRLGPGDTVRL